MKHRNSITHKTDLNGNTTHACIQNEEEMQFIRMLRREPEKTIGALQKAEKMNKRMNCKTFT